MTAPQAISIAALFAFLLLGLLGVRGAWKHTKSSRTGMALLPLVLAILLILFAGWGLIIAFVWLAPK